MHALIRHRKHRRDTSSDHMKMSNFDRQIHIVTKELFIYLTFYGTLWLMVSQARQFIWMETVFCHIKN